MCRTLIIIVIIVVFLLGQHGMLWNHTSVPPQARCRRGTATGRGREAAGGWRGSPGCAAPRSSLQAAGRSRISLPPVPVSRCSPGNRAPAPLRAPRGCLHRSGPNEPQTAASRGSRSTLINRAGASPAPRPGIPHRPRSFGPRSRLAGTVPGAGLGPAPGARS